MQTQTKKLASMIIAGLALAASCARAELAAPAATDWTVYAEPAVVAAFPGDFENAVGGALAVGTTYKGRHSIEADYIWFKSKEWPADVTFTPILATYKYAVPMSGPWSLTAGAAVGATHERAKSYYWGSWSQTAFTYGLVAGGAYALTSHWSVNVDAWVLRLDATNITTSGNIVLVTAGVSYRF